MQFKKEYYFLSNMCPCTNGVSVMIDDKIYKFTCAEAAFQAFKCPQRASEFENIDGYTAKKLGKRVQLRSDWEQIKNQIMLNVVCTKFMQNPDMFRRLRNTKSIIVEENTWGDTYWGVCNGVGENHLGKILMKIRDEVWHDFHTMQ